MRSNGADPPVQVAVPRSPACRDDLQDPVHRLSRGLRAARKLISAGRPRFPAHGAGGPFRACRSQRCAHSRLQPDRTASQARACVRLMAQRPDTGQPILDTDAISFSGSLECPMRAAGFAALLLIQPVSIIDTGVLNRPPATGCAGLQSRRPEPASDSRPRCVRTRLGPLRTDARQYPSGR